MPVVTPAVEARSLDANPILGNQYRLRDARFE